MQLSRHFFFKWHTKQAHFDFNFKYCSSAVCWSQLSFSSAAQLCGILLWYFSASFIHVSNKVHCITVFGPQICPVLLVVLLLFVFGFFLFICFLSFDASMARFLTESEKFRQRCNQWKSSHPTFQKGLWSKETDPSYSTWAPKWQKWSCLIFCGLGEAPVCSTCCKNRRGSIK